MNEAWPVYTEVFRLNTWLLSHLGDDSRVLSRSICRRALHLHSSLLSALKDRDRWASLDEADACLVTLRGELRLAGATHMLSNKQMLFALDMANRIGCQIGGWLKALDME